MTRLVPAVLFSGLFAVLQLWFAAIFVHRSELGLTDTAVLAVFAAKFLFDLSLLMAGISLLSRCGHSIVLGCVFSTLYLWLLLANVMVYLHGNMLFAVDQLGLITTYSLGSYWGPASAAALLLWMVIPVISYVFSRSVAGRATFRRAVVWAVIAVLMAVLVTVGSLVSRRSGDRFVRLQHVGRFTIPGVVGDLCKRLPIRRAPPSKSGHGGDSGASAQQSSKLSRLRPVLDRYNLPQGERTYAEIGGAPFTRVVVIFVEGLSLDLLHCCNPRLSLETTPFLCSDDLRQSIFVNLWSSGSPTLRGLSAVFNSNPNPVLQRKRRTRSSLANVISEHGFHTVFLRSASRYYGKGDQVLAMMGFEQIIGSEDFAEELDQYVYDWGLEDRKLYDQLVELLDHHRHEEIFVAVLGTDTHPLHGREHRSPEVYPPPPNRLESGFGAAAPFMEAVHRADHDLQRLVASMKSRDLLDEQTLLIITADHSCPPNPVTRHIPGHSRATLGRIPLLILSGRELPPVRRELLGSQLDVAPTILHLLGLPVPESWWGDSMFFEKKCNPAVGVDERTLIIRDTEGLQLVPLSGRGGPENDALIKLFD